MPEIKKHVHRLQRKRYKTGAGYYICTLPDCYFKVNCDLTLNKTSLCNKCGKPFLMNQYSIRLARPHCPECHQPNTKKYKSTVITRLEEGNEVSTDFIDNLMTLKLPDSSLTEESNGSLGSMQSKLHGISNTNNIEYAEYNPDEEL